MNPTADPTQADELVTVEAVSKRFGATQALDAVSLVIRPGETVGLLGRNGAGKSTLVAALTGLIKIDSGSIRIDGHRMGDDAARGVISCLYQHSTLLPSLSVTENLFIDRIDNARGGFINWRTAHAEAQRALLEWGVDVDPRTRVEELTFEEKQSVELARALSRGSRLIILDEPTAQLDSHQATRLHERVKQLHERGVSFLYISHFLPEVFDVCDRAVVFRDGRTVLTADVAELDEPTIISAMSGSSSDTLAQHSRGNSERAAQAGPVLAISELVLEGAFGPVSFDVRPGQVVGLAGSLRSGATEVGRVLSGLASPTGGTVSIHGKPVELGTVRRSLNAGISSVPQDRQHEGLFPQLGVDENVTATTPEQLGRYGFLSPYTRSTVAERIIRDFAVSAESTRTPIESLSGGNQQKALFGRAFESSPEILILDTPTAGVDIVSTSAIFDQLEAASAQGLATLIASNTLTELRACDVVHVMFQGRITATFDQGWRSEDLIAAIEGVTEV